MNNSQHCIGQQEDRNPRDTTAGVGKPLATVAMPVTHNRRDNLLKVEVISKPDSHATSRPDKTGAPHSTPQVITPLAQLVESFVFEGDFIDHLALIPSQVAEQIKAAQSASQFQKRDRRGGTTSPHLSSGRRSVSTRQVSTGFEDGSFADSTLDDPILAEGKAPFHPTEATIGRVQQLDTSYSSTHTNNPFALSYNQVPNSGPPAAQATGQEFDRLGSSTSANSLNGADSNFATGSTEGHTLTADDSDFLASPAPPRAGSNLVAKRSPARPLQLPAVVEADELTGTSAGPIVSNPLVFHPLRNSEGHPQMPTFFASSSVSAPAPSNKVPNQTLQINVLACRETVRVAETLLQSLLRPDDATAVAAVRALRSVPAPLSTRPIDLPAQSITDFLVKHSTPSSSAPRRDSEYNAHPALITKPEWLILYTAETPATSFQTYCSRIVAGLQLDPEQVVIALCLMRKVSCYTPLCTRSAHRQFLAAVLLASKLRLDVVWTLKHYARCGGVSTAELGAMEVAMLDILGFDVGVSTPEYIEMLYSLRQHCATMAYVKKRDWAATAWGTMAEQIPLPTVELLRSEYANRTATIDEDGSQWGTFDGDGSPLSNVGAGGHTSHGSLPTQPKAVGLLPTDPSRFGSVSNISITAPARPDTVLYRYRYNGLAYPPTTSLVQSLLPKQWEGADEVKDDRSKRAHRKSSDVGKVSKEMRPPPSWAERCATATASQNKRAPKTASRPAPPSSSANPSHPLLQGNTVGNAMVQQGQRTINATGEVPVFMGLTKHEDPTATLGPVPLMYPEQLAQHQQQQQQGYYQPLNYQQHANSSTFTVEMHRAMQHSNESSVASLNTAGSAGTLHSNDSQFLAPGVGLVPATYVGQPQIFIQAPAQPVYHGGTGIHGQVPYIGYPPNMGYHQGALPYTSNQIPTVPQQANNAQWLGHQQGLQYGHFRAQ